ncbi:RNA polymerase subunit sigma [Bacillus sp. Y1]|nr:sigma-70 family RNA polymerase sigma factor [Bacillus sp. Y1]AYA76428.1 RNA polymerase subunit sigma [Bacillus sp. Y1]
MEDSSHIEAKSKEELIAELLALYGTELKRIAFMYVHDHALTEDILQEVFIACYNNLHNFRGESSYKTWLVKIMVNKCKDSLRRWSMRNIIYKPKIDIQKLHHSSPELTYISKVEDIELVAQVMSLPIKLRDVIILFYYQELSVEEISSILSININTVKSRLFRARKKLEESMRGGNHEWRIN